MSMIGSAAWWEVSCVLHPETTAKTRIVEEPRNWRRDNSGHCLFIGLECGERRFRVQDVMAPSKKLESSLSPAGNSVSLAMRRLRGRTLFGLFLMVCRLMLAAEPTVSSNDLPRFPPVEPRDAIKTFQIEKGFHLEIAAAEPNLASPVALSF